MAEFTDIINNKEDILLFESFRKTNIQYLHACWRDMKHIYLSSGQDCVRLMQYGYYLDDDDKRRIANYVSQFNSLQELDDDLYKIYKIKKPCTFHEWGDCWFCMNGGDFNSAIDEIGEKFRKIRVFVYDKEKFGSYNCTLLGLYDGTLRWALGEYSVRKETNWYDYIDRFFAKILKILGIVSLVQKIQIRQVNNIMQKMCKKYPMFINEFIVDFDMYEWIKPNKYGDVVGKQIFDKYWQTNS